MLLKLVGFDALRLRLQTEKESETQREGGRERERENLQRLEGMEGAVVRLSLLVVFLLTLARCVDALHRLLHTTEHLHTQGERGERLQ